jgi:hypothetical protein
LGKIHGKRLNFIQGNFIRKAKVKFHDKLRWLFEIGSLGDGI